MLINYWNFRIVTTLTRSTYIVHQFFFREHAFPTDEIPITMVSSMNCWWEHMSTSDKDLSPFNPSQQIILSMYLPKFSTTRVKRIWDKGSPWWKPLETPIFLGGGSINNYYKSRRINKLPTQFNKFVAATKSNQNLNEEVPVDSIICFGNIKFKKESLIVGVLKRMNILMISNDGIQNLMT